MIRAHIHRAYIEATDNGQLPPRIVPIGWDYEVYDTTTRCTLIARTAVTQSHALREACRHIRLATELSTNQPLTY